MDCRNSQTQFSVYLDGELSSREREQLQSHLKECLACYRQWVSLQKSVNLLQNLPDIDPPAHLSPVVMAKLNERHFHQRAGMFTDRHRWLSLAVAVAATVAISVALWQILPSTLTWHSVSRNTSERVVAREAPTDRPSAQLATSERSGVAAGPVMVLRVEDFSRADQELESLLRSFSQPTLQGERPGRPAHSSSARLIDFRVPGQNYTHFIRELHKIGNLDEDQVIQYRESSRRQPLPVSIRIIVVKDK
jgi:hypothetical protein